MRRQRPAPLATLAARELNGVFSGTLDSQALDLVELLLAARHQRPATLGTLAALAWG